MKFEQPPATPDTGEIPEELKKRAAEAQRRAAEAEMKRKGRHRPGEAVDLTRELKEL